MQYAALFGILILGLILLGCGNEPGTGIDCRDPDGDGYGEGADCLGPDCTEADDTCWEGACCQVDCTDGDGDGYGAGADCLGPDCDDADDACWEGACCQVVLDCTYYVDNTTSSTDWAAAQDISTPCTPETAMANAQAGNVVCFRGGTYELGECEDVFEHAKLEPDNSGSPGSPITFVAYGGETPIMNCICPGACDPPRTRVLGNNFNDFITWDGFTVQANNGAKPAGIVLWGSTNHLADGAFGQPADYPSRRHLRGVRSQPVRRRVAADHAALVRGGLGDLHVAVHLAGLGRTARRKQPRRGLSGLGSCVLKRLGKHDPAGGFPAGSGLPLRGIRKKRREHGCQH